MEEIHFAMAENGEAIVGVFLAVLAGWSLYRAGHLALSPWLNRRRQRVRILPRTEDERD